MDDLDFSLTFSQDGKLGQFEHALKTVFLGGQSEGEE
jgi:hypothetical protein